MGKERLSSITRIIICIYMYVAGSISTGKTRGVQGSRDGRTLLYMKIYRFVAGNDLSTACTVVKRRGEFLTRLVKTNSKRDWLYLDVMQRACVLPLNLDLAFRMDMLSTVLNPTPAIHNTCHVHSTITNEHPRNGHEEDVQCFQHDTRRKKHLW